jgi:hypothetical protein
MGYELETPLAEVVATHRSLQVLQHALLEANLRLESVLLRSQQLAELNAVDGARWLEVQRDLADSRRRRRDAFEALTEYTLESGFDCTQVA